MFVLARAQRVVGGERAMYEQRQVAVELDETVARRQSLLVAAARLACNLKSHLHFTHKYTFSSKKQTALRMARKYASTPRSSQQEFDFDEDED